MNGFAKWVLIYEVCGDYVVFNERSPTDTMEGIGASMAWVTPNVPAEVVEIAKMRVVGRDGQVIVLSHVTCDPPGAKRQA